MKINEIEIKDKKIKKSSSFTFYSLLFTTSLSIFTLISCVPNTNISPNNIKSQQLNEKLKLSGKVEFPKGFKTKANETTGQVLTVSLIYPPEHPTKPNTVAIAGITNTDGTFSLTPQVDFDPNKNDVFILEAVKRDEVTNNILTLRTYVRWLDPKWESITKPNLVINSLTTAITILQSNNFDTIKSPDTIGKIDLSTTTPVIGTIGVLQNTDINQIESVVTKSLLDNLDPISSIRYVTEEKIYIIKESLVTAKLGSNYECGTCDRNDLSRIKYSGQDLTGQTFKNKNFSKSDLSYNDMKATNLYGSNFSESNLTGCYMIGTNIENANLSKSKMDLADLGGANGKNANMSNITSYLLNADYSDFTGADFSNSSLASSNFLGADLTNSKFNNANLSSSNFENAKVTNTDFSGANMSNSTWIDGSTIDDGKICASGSIGICN